MTKPQDPMDAQAVALLETLRGHVEQRCRELRDAAERDAAALLREARRGARVRMHQAIQAERKQSERKIQMAVAGLETVRRQRRQEKAKHLLEQGWEPLREALRRRWQEPAARRLWCRSLVEQALGALGSGDWRIEHPADWKPAELGELTHKMAERAGSEPTFAARRNLAAGLRISAAGACLDGTIDGLLADRAEIEGLLLAEFARAKEKGEAKARASSRGNRS